jgi:tRNA-splicing ligase RtcB
LFLEFKKLREAVYEIQKSGAMRVPVRLYAGERLLAKMQTDRTLGQARNVASLPGIVDASMVMPDGHEGYGFPIGGVAAFSLADEGNGVGVVSPGGVGYDINCGVRLLTSTLSAKEVQPKIKEIVNALFENVPSGVGSKKIRVDERTLGEAVERGCAWAVERGYGVADDAEHCEENGAIPGADFSKTTPAARKRGMPQFGTLGSGNHFLEVQRVEKIFDAEAAKAFRLPPEGGVTVMIHCGSRGFGHQTCDDYIRVMLRASEKYGIPLPDKELCCAPLGSPEANDYFGAMNCAVNYAFCNRHVIAHWVRESFEQAFQKKQGDWEAMGLRTVYDVCHNIAKIEEHAVKGNAKKICVHRKGATRAFWSGRKEVPSAYRSVGQPVIIPGTMETASYVLVGSPLAAETFGSVCHGAGRVMSRHEAIRAFRGVSVQGEMAKRGITVQSAEPVTLAEEAGGAYKNVDDVVASVEQAGLARAVAKLVPLGVIKG